MNNSSNGNISMIKSNSINLSFKYKKRKRASLLKRTIIYFILLLFIVNCFIIFRLYLNKNISFFDNVKKYFILMNIMN